MRRAAVLVACAAVGFLFGFGTSSIPSPHDVSVFWIGNLCAPWLVLSFFAGRMQRSLGWAVLAGVLVDVACVVGFYIRFLTLDPLKLGLPPATPLTTVATTSLRHWLFFIALWLAAGAVGGAVYGALGSSWRRSKPLAAGLAVALPFVAEPGLWPLRNGYYQGPWFIWAVEVAVGLAVALCVVGIRSRTVART